MDEWKSNEDEEEHRPIKDTYREDYERKKVDAEENAAIFGFVLSVVMLCFQIANCIVGKNCECPFIESIPTILQVCGGFGIVLFATVYVVAKYFTKWESCGLVCLSVLAMDILGYIGCLIAAAFVAFRNYSTWTEGNHESCDCFDYTFWMVLANFALFIVACIIFIMIGIRNGENCSTGELKCRIGKQCYPKENRCNVIEDCPDGEDEYECDVCNKNAFKCPKEERCIPEKRLCDGRADCNDFADELGCGECGADELVCIETLNLNLKCIHASKILDGNNDCGQCSDENFSEECFYGQG